MRKRSFATCIVCIPLLASLSISCMNSNPTAQNSKEAIHSSLNTSEPGKPNYVDLSTSPLLQQYANEQIALRRREVFQTSQPFTKEQALKTSTIYYYGLLRGTNYSTGFADTALIYMDDEDDFNESVLTYNGNNVMFNHNGVRSAKGTVHWHGWLGITQLTENGDDVTGTMFRIVKLGTTTALPAARIDYVVFRMGEQCPPGSLPFMRYFHNEGSTGYNQNWTEGNIEPQAYSVPSARTMLEFCFVPKDTNSTTVLWHDGQENGVFAHPDSSPLPPNGTGLQNPWWCNEKAAVFTDDEDQYNANYWDYGSMSQDYIDRIKTFMSGTVNTQLFFTWCRPIPLGVY